jgi:AcrR family transcriptional regulator
VSVGRRAETSAESQARILDAAADLVAEQGLRATTVQAVAERAGISHTSVAWHFGSKDGLARAVTAAAFAEVFARFAALADEPGPRTVDRLLEAHREITASRPGQVFARVLPEVVVGDGPLREIYVDGYRRIRELVAAYLGPVVAASASTEPAALVAGAVFAAGAGVNLLRALDAGPSRRAGFALVTSVFAATLAPTQSRKATARAGAALNPTRRRGKTPKVKPVAGS